MKQPGGLRKVRHVGRWKIQQVAYLWAAAYNLLRLTHLEAAGVGGQRKGEPGSRAEERNARASRTQKESVPLFSADGTHLHLKNHPFFNTLLNQRPLCTSGEKSRLSTPDTGVSFTAF